MQTEDLLACEVSVWRHFLCFTSRSRRP